MCRYLFYSRGADCSNEDIYGDFPMITATGTF